ncbi:MAG: hypothetical protein Fur0012_02290 [Elusimicrobiota bacterium]
MKKMIFITMLAMSAGGFSQSIESVSLADIKAGAASFKGPIPSAPVSEDDEITADLSVRVPFKAVKKLFLEISEGDGRISLIDPSADIIYNSGETLLVRNLKMNVNGIMAEPVLALKPYLEGRNKIAVKIEKVKFHVLMMPDKSRAASSQDSKIEDAMDQVMSLLITEINKTLDEKFKKDGLSLSSKDLLSMKYYKNEWILRASVSGKIVNNFIPAGFVGEPYLSGFSFDSKALYIKVKTGK